MKSKIKISIIGSFLISSVFASETPSQIRSFGINFGILSQPYPSLASLNFAYNANENIRISVGAGSLLFGGSYGAGIQYQFKNEDFTPTLGIHITQTNVGNPFSGLFGGSPTPDLVFWTSTLSAGVEWRWQSGFCVGAGLNGAWLVVPSSAIATRFLPYLSFSYFF